MECRDHRLCQVGRRVRPPASAARRALRHGRGVRRSLPAAVGQLGRRCLHCRQAGRPLRPAGQPPGAGLQGQVLHGRRRVERAAAAARPSGADPGGLLRPRPGARDAHRRRGVFRAERGHRGAGLLHGPESAGGRRRPATRRRADHAGRLSGDRAHRAGGAGDLRRAEPTDRHGAGLHGAVGPAGTDMSVHPLDGPVPARPRPSISRAAPRPPEMARREKPLRQLFHPGGGAWPSVADRQLLQIAGAGKLVPLRRRRRLQRDAAVLPGNSTPSSTGVVPVAGARPVSRDYEGPSLREHLGLRVRRGVSAVS